MRNGLSILFIMLVAVAHLTAQKVDIDKKSVVTNLIALPSKDVDTSFHTYSYKFTGSYNLTTWGMDIDAAQENYFKLAGYELEAQNGDLKLEATLPPIKFLDSNVQSRTEKTKDKSGRETSKNYYKHVLSYESGFSWKITDKSGKELTNKMLSTQMTSIKKHEGTEYGTYKEASDSYNNNRAQVNRDIASGEITSFLSGMYQSMNAQFGYRTDKDKFNIWVIGSKSHPEFEAFQTHYETVKAAFAGMATTGITAADLEALKPAIDYYISIPEKFKADEKADIKLRYASYFNLANIYLMLDNTDKVEEYANLIIKNDYDKDDGKDFLKDAEKLKELLQKKKAPARRFSRSQNKA
jgi:hypothetical protein